MSTARMLALLALAAVFSMHGLQCVAGEPGDSHGDMALMQGPLSAGSDGGTMLMSSAVDVITGNGAHVGATAVDGTPTTGHTPFHNAVHALAVCVAIMLSGFAVLGALLVVRRSAHLTDRGPVRIRARSWWTSTQLLRPPDLASLCLLRI